MLNASGYVVARRQATVSSKVTGKVAEVLIEEGMAVKEGQLLARLDDTTTRPLYSLSQRQLDAARKNLNEVEVRVAEAERNLRRTQQLRQDKLVSELQLDQAQSEAAALNARLEALRSEVQVAEGTVRVRAQDLDDLMVRSPFDGVVVSKDAQPGEMVSPISAGGGFTRTGIATVVDMDSREIEVDVNEAFINRVKANQKTEAVLDAYPDFVIPESRDQHRADCGSPEGDGARAHRVRHARAAHPAGHGREGEFSRGPRSRGRRAGCCAEARGAHSLSGSDSRRRHELRLARAGRASSNASRSAPAASATARSKCSRASIRATSWSRRRSKG